MHTYIYIYIWTRFLGQPESAEESAHHANELTTTALCLKTKADIIELASVLQAKRFWRALPCTMEVNLLVPERFRESVKRTLVDGAQGGSDKREGEFDYQVGATQKCTCMYARLDGCRMALRVIAMPGLLPFR